MQVTQEVMEQKIVHVALTSEDCRFLHKIGLHLESYDSEALHQAGILPHRLDEFLSVTRQAIKLLQQQG